MPSRDDARSGHAWTEDEEFGVPAEVVRRPRPDLGEDWHQPPEGPDTTEVRLDDPDLWSYARGEPDWVIRSHYRDEELGEVRSGKEASVVLVRRISGERSCLLARKRYRPRAMRAFRREEAYQQGRGLGDERVDRAVAKRTRFGREILEYAWAYREFPLMRTAWELGVTVPYPVEALDDGVVMEYVGDDEGPAPRLVDIRLTASEAEDAFEQVVEDVRRMLDGYLVHADLSAYNILWWQERAWIIDFPQAVDVTHVFGIDFLRRDIDNVCSYFRRCGLDPDPGALFEDVLRTSPMRWGP